MFKFSELDQIQIEITNNCQASCPLCSRNVHGGLDNPLLKIKEWSLDNFKQIFNNEVLFQITKINFAGSFGEPILHNDLIKMCQHVTDINPQIHITVCTNGSARSSNWWSRLAKALPPNHRVVFAIDGLEDTHTLYRIGTNYQNIIKNAITFIKAGGTAEWQFIKFKHNQHQVEQGRALAKEYGFVAFNVKNSRRHGEPFKVLDKAGKTTHYLDAADGATINIIRKEDFIKYKDWTKSSQINCYAKKDKEIFIDAHYTLLPCCILPSFMYLNIDYNAELYKEYKVYSAPSHYDAGYGLQDNFLRLIEELGGVTKLNATSISIKDIIESTVWQTIWERKWKEKSSEVCIKFCSASSPFSSIDDQTTTTEHY